MVRPLQRWCHALPALLAILCSPSPVEAVPGAPASTHGPEIIHEAIECWPRHEFLVLRASFRPASDIQTAKVYFRSNNYTGPYYVEMTLNERGEGRAVLPKPGVETASVIYYLEMVTRSYHSARTEQWNAPVADGNECKRRDPSSLWFSGDQPNIVVGATRLGAAPIPPGFQATGISGFVSASGAAGSAGGGLGAKTAVIAVGGAAAAVLALTAGGDGSATSTALGAVNTSSSSTTSVGPGPTTVSTTTTTTGGGASTTTSVGTSSTTTVGPSTTTTVGTSTTTTVGSSSTTTGPATSSTTTTASTSSTTTVPTTSSTTTPSSTTTSSVSTTTTSVAAGADLRLTIGDSPDPVPVGGNLTYTLTVTNLGPATATGAVLVATLPPTVTFLALFPPAGATCGADVNCLFQPIPSGQQRVVTVVVGPNSPGALTYSGNVGAIEPDPNLSNNSASTSTTVTSSLREIGSEVDLTFASFVGVADYDRAARGQILVNGSVLEESDSAAPRVHRVKARAGENRIEAYLESGAGSEGSWRFDFAGTPEFTAGSLRVESGQVVSLESYGVVFDLGGGGAGVIRFTFELQR